MAEIKIKKKQPIWPLILVALVILALVYFMFFRNNEVVKDKVDDVKEMVTDDRRDSDYMKDNNVVLLSAMATSKISEYKTYIANDAKMGVDHEYSDGAFTRLIHATEAVANSLEVDVKADLEKARENAASLKKDPSELNHANMIKKAGNNIAHALEKIQRQKYPTLNSNIEELQNSVAAIDPDKKALDQRNVIKDFYQEAGKLLTNMKNI